AVRHGRHVTDPRLLLSRVRRGLWTASRGSGLGTASGPHAQEAAALLELDEPDDDEPDEDEPDEPEVDVLDDVLDDEDAGAEDEEDDGAVADELLRESVR